MQSSSALIAPGVAALAWLAPQRAHQVLRGVQHGAERGEVEQGCRALQRMDRPERRIHPRRVGACLLQRQQVAGCLLHQVPPFEHELFQQFVHHVTGR